MILNDIKNALKEFDENVFYGLADPKMKDELWNYIVFDRSVKKISENKTGFSTVYSVHIIREEFIPEGLEEEVIKKVLAIPGMKLAGNDGEYVYVAKQNTDTVVEMFSIDFVKASKRV